MPRLSLYRSEKTNDYKFLDSRIKEMFTIGATDLYIHKYLGIKDQGATSDLTMPRQTTPDPTKIQDLLFLENRDRKYDPDIYRIRGHYNVQNLDFDLSQFGLFLNNDIIFITVHYNDMIDLIGRKLMVGDVFELPHLTDYHPLNETIPTSLRRYYQITDANFASEGFSSTWYPHLWRIKCEPLVDSQEYSDILSSPMNKDNYLGDWDKTKTYVPGYVVKYGDKNYTSLSNVAENIPVTGPMFAQGNLYTEGQVVVSDGTSYLVLQDTEISTPLNDTLYFQPIWELSISDSLKDVISRYNTNIQINDAAIAEAARLLPQSGYDRTQLYVVPTENNKPALPVGVLTNGLAPVPTRGTVQLMYSKGYAKPSPAVKISASQRENLKLLMADAGKALETLYRINLELIEIAPTATSTGSGQVFNDVALAVQAIGSQPQPYGTSDTIAARTDQDPTQPNFDGTIIPDIMNYRADTDPRYHYVAKASPLGFGYSAGYMTGDGTAPNGEPTGAGITFPSSPIVGDYFLRTDYLPQQLFRWDGKLWVKISEKVRTGTALGADDQSIRSTFINNTNTTTLSDGSTIPERQSLSTMLKIQAD